MTSPEKTALFDFEKIADSAIKKISIAGLPAHSVWVHFHWMVFVLYHFEGARDPATRRSAETRTYRMSYVLDWIADRTAAEEDMPAAEADAMFREMDPGAKGAIALDGYAHLTEVLPDVRRDRTKVGRIKGGFRFDHLSNETARAEATDILVSALAMPHLANLSRRHFTPALKAIFQNDPIDWQGVLMVAAERVAGYHDDIREDAVISDAAMMTVFDFSAERFREIQAAVFAFAEVCQELALIGYMETADANGDPADRVVDLISISRPEDELIDWITQLAKGDRTDVAKFIDIFTFDPTAAKRRGGEGYTPPFVRTGTRLCFSADIILRFIQPRNAIYDLMRKDQKTFDNLVSKTMEPTLIDAVALHLDAFSGQKYAKQVTYGRKGEIDLMIVDPATEDVVIFEVKGPLAPQGSRSTDRLAGRVRHGIDQLERFRELTDAERLAVVESGTSLKLKNPKFHYVIMARACLGATEVWLPNATVTPATLPLMRLALQALNLRGDSVAGELSSELKSLTAELLRDAKWHWSSGKMELFGKKIFTPQLRYDEGAVDRWRRRAAGEAV